jgi:cytochrome P450
MSEIEATDQDLQKLSENFDPFANSFWDRRLQVYRYLHRSQRTLLRSERHGGFWYAIGYTTVLDVQSRPEVFSNYRFTIPDRPVPPLIPATLDPPEHMPFKRLLSTFFTPQQAMQLRQRVAGIVEPLLLAGRARGRTDMVAEVMMPLMAELTMVDILGLEAANAMPYATPVHHMTRRDYPRDAAERDMRWLADQMRDDLRNGRVRKEAILGRLGGSLIDGRRLSEDELLHIAINLLIGGMGTTAFFTGSVIVFLGRHAGYRQQLLADDALLPSALEELLRVYTPTQTFGRSIKEDVVVENAQLRKGDKILLGYGGANFDPRAFADPDNVEFRRKPVRHMSFGIGPHRCLGSHVAKLIVSTVIDLLLRRAPDFCLDEAGVKRNDAAASMFGYNSVPIMFQ